MRSGAAPKNATLHALAANAAVASRRVAASGLVSGAVERGDCARGAIDHVSALERLLGNPILSVPSDGLPLYRPSVISNRDAVGVSGPVLVRHAGISASACDVVAPVRMVRWPSSDSASDAASARAPGVALDHQLGPA